MASNMPVPVSPSVAPGFAGGGQVSALTEFLDLYPTLCELAGLPIPVHVEGKSLVPFLRGDDVTLHEAAITQMLRRSGKNATMGWSLRTRRYRYQEWRIANLGNNKPVFGKEPIAVELYDYGTDPLERENVADRPGYASVLKTRQQLFDKLLPHLPRAQRP